MHEASAKSPIIPTPAHDGARVLWRLWNSSMDSQEGWLREFSPDGRRVRICRKKSKRDRGAWIDCKTIRIEAVLEESKAPDESKPTDDETGGDDE